MRTKFSYTSALVLILLISFVNYQCKNKDKCDTAIEIEELLPDNNPAGYEIQIKGTGFTQAAIVRFGTKTAVTRWYAEESALIAEVPNGLSGPVEVTVEEGDCIGRADFEVTSGQNTDWPPSLANIVIPQTPTDFPAGFTNFYTNIADNKHHFSLVSDGNSIDCAFCNESHDSLQVFNNNPITGTIKIIPQISSEIHLIVDRTSNFGISDTLDGQFIEPVAAGIIDYNTAILLQSRVNGRQFIFGANF